MTHGGRILIYVELLIATTGREINSRGENAGHVRCILDKVMAKIPAVDEYRYLNLRRYAISTEFCNT